MSEINETVKVIARSPGERPVLIVEAAGRLLAVHFETSYDLGAGKPVEADWVLDNAVGRHSFISVEPAEEVSTGELEDYATGD